jgi:hypothetical protein
MHERNVLGRESGGSVATASFVAIIVIAVLVALFVWAPWESTSSPMPVVPQNMSANGVDRAAH